MLVERRLNTAPVLPGALKDALGARTTPCANDLVAGRFHPNRLDRSGFGHGCPLNLPEGVELRPYITRRSYPNRPVM